MGEWQRQELDGAPDVAYIVAMHENALFQAPTGDDLARWRDELDFEADVLLLDYNRGIIDTFIDANPGPIYTEAVTVIIDKGMRIRKVGSTYNAEHENNLELVQDLLSH